MLGVDPAAAAASHFPSLAVAADNIFVAAVASRLPSYSHRRRKFLLTAGYLFYFDGFYYANANVFDQEVSQYLLLTKNEAAFSEVNVIAFWKQHCLQFPLLAKIASVYLAVSASSVPVECLFSTTGLILNSKRSCMIYL